MRRELAVLAIVVAVSEVRAGDDPPGDYYGQLAATVKAKLDALVASHAPKLLVPPVPIKPVWKAAKVGSIDLGAPLVALAAANLDGDPRSSELYAVTPREVIAIGYKAGKLVELARAPFAGDRAVPEPRDVVGTIVVENGEIVAAASPWAKELRLKWSGKALTAQAGVAGFLLCPGVRAQLQPGRNHFVGDTFETRCREDLVDAAGYPLRVRADLATTGRLTVVVEKCPEGTCETNRFEYPNVGIAFAIADVDRDGTPEIVVSEASAPGSTDSWKVHTLGGDDKKPVFRRMFNGGVAGLVVADGDDADDIAEVIAAVRLPGSTRVDVWRLD